MARARWHGGVLAETSHPVLLEGNVCVRPEDVAHEALARTRVWPLCPRQGLARCCTVPADGPVNRNAAWSYPHPGPPARKIKNQVAFGNGIQVDAGAGG